MPLTARTAARLIRARGGVLVRHGAKHDVYETPDGIEIQVPRHPGDLSPSVERDIKRKLGCYRPCRLTGETNEIRV